MGIGVEIPKLGTDVKFNDNKYEVAYRSSVSIKNIKEEMKKTSAMKFSILMVIVMAFSLIVSLYEKKKL